MVRRFITNVFRQQVSFYVIAGLVLMVAPAGVTFAQSKPDGKDLSGRVVDDSGAPVPDADVWAVGGPWSERVTIAATKTDKQGSFVLANVWEQQAVQSAMAAGTFGLIARTGDGRVGWLAPVDRRGPSFREGTAEISIGAAEEVRGRVVDHNGKPIEGAIVTPVMVSRPGGARGVDLFVLNLPVMAAYQTKTAQDGSFVLKSFPKGARLQAAVETQGLGWLHFQWDVSQPVTVAFHDRVGQVKGRIKLPDAGGLPDGVSVLAQLSERSGGPATVAYQRLYSKTVPAAKDGSFLLDGLPPGSYQIDLVIGQNAPIAQERVEHADVRSDAVAAVEVTALRLFSITGRVVDAVTGKGIAGVPVRCYRTENETSINETRLAKTDAQGRYTIAAWPGMVKIVPDQLPLAHLVPKYQELPEEQVLADRAWPDLKMGKATDVDGIVVDEKGQPVAGAQVYLYRTIGAELAGQNDRAETGPGGAFHFDQLDADETVSLWARSKFATTDGAVSVTPGGIQGKLTLTIDPSFACAIRGMATDTAGGRIEGARVRLWWGRGDEARQVPTIVDSFVTSKNGWFIFRGLWKGFRYSTEVEASGHTTAVAHTILTEAAETRDVGKVVLASTRGRLAGRVIGSNGQPLVGAAVFNRGDGPEIARAITDSTGCFQLGALRAGTKYAFVRADGYRFTGVKSDGDADAMRIIMLKITEPPPQWKPVATVSFDEQRAFAKQILTRLWEKIGARADGDGALPLVSIMARIDLELATKWSAEKGHRHDRLLRLARAERMAETDAPGAIALLANDRGRDVRAFLQAMAVRFGPTDKAKAVAFAEEVAVRARDLPEKERAAALATAGAALVRFGRAEAGRALIAQAVLAAGELGNEDIEARDRAIVAGVVAPDDLKRALALIEPIQADDKDRFVAYVARAIARTDTIRGVARADLMSGETPVPERVKTAIAFRIGADQPDEAIRIIEGMKRENPGRWRAEALGWLAVALEPREKARAFDLIDRALDMLVDESGTGASATKNSDERMMAAAHVAARAQQIGYPDMDSVVMRVMAARPEDGTRGARREVRVMVLATISLALVDPGAARDVLNQLEAEFDPAKFVGARAPWLSAWSLVDIKKAAAVFEAQLVAVENDQNPDSLLRGFLSTAELLATPPKRREDVLQEGLYGGSWRPGEALGYRLGDR